MGLKLIGEVSLDGSGFERGLNRLSAGAVSGFRNTVAAAFGTVAIGQLVRGTVEWASKLNDVSDALGVNVEWLQKMQNGAQLVGGDIQDIERMLLEINKSRQEALQNPEGKNAQAFARAGLTPGDIRGLSTQDFADKFIKAFASGVTTQGAIDIQEVGGRSARNLIAAFATQFASDTPILAAALIRQLDDIGDAFTDLATTLKVTLAPIILYIGQRLKDLANSAGQTFSGLKGGHAAAIAGAADDLQKGLPLLSRMANVWENFAKGFQNSVVSAEADQRDIQDQIEIARNAANTFRKKREQASPDFSFANLRSARAQPGSDPLLAVGNFLGAGRTAIEGIAEAHLAVSRESLTEQKKQTAALGKLIEKTVTVSLDDTDWPE